MGAASVAGSRSDAHRARRCASRRRPDRVARVEAGSVRPKRPSAARKPGRDERRQAARRAAPDARRGGRCTRGGRGCRAVGAGSRPGAAPARVCAPPPAANAARSIARWSSTPPAARMTQCAPKSARLDGDDEPAVGERRVAARQAHAVDDDAVGLGGRRARSSRPGTCRSCRRRAAVDGRARADRRPRGSADGRRRAPYCMRSMSGCGCSTRTPIANGLGFERDARRASRSRRRRARSARPPARRVGRELAPAAEPHAADARARRR